MSSVGTRGAGPVAKTGAASSDQPTSSRRPLPMTVSPTVEPASGVPRNAATIGDRATSTSAQPRGERRAACASASAGSLVTTIRSGPPPRSSSTNARSPTTPSAAQRNR